MYVVWQAGGYATASALYKESLEVLRESDTSLEDVAKKTEMVVMFLYVHCDLSTIVVWPFKWKLLAKLF